MEVEIDDKELEQLYTTGKSRKLRLPQQVIDKFFATIQKIESAISIHDLWADKGLNFKRLKGYENRHSMRLSGKYRLEMSITWTDENQTIGKFYLLTISNHYGD